MTYNLVISKAPVYNMVVGANSGINVSIQKQNPINIVIEKSGNGLYQRKIFIGPTPPPPGMLEPDDFWFQTFD
jgi:hypothetical protein